MANELTPISGGLPAHLQGGHKVNDDVTTSAPFPQLSIKGKRFTIVKDGVKKVVMHPDRPDEVAQSLEVVVKRANMKAKVFYLAKYDPASSDGMVPDCYSMDGVTPAPGSKNKQHSNCAACPKNVWGARDGKGKECNDQVRLAIAPAGQLDAEMLLRVPPASIKPFKDAVKGIKARNGQYNAVVYRIGFDIEAESPKLTFTPTSWVTQEQYAKINEAYDSQMVKEIIGVVDNGAENLPTNDLGDAPTHVAAPAPAPQPAPAPAPAPRPAVQAPTPAPAPVAAKSDVMSELDDILGGRDD